MRYASAFLALTAAAFLALLASCFFAGFSSCKFRLKAVDTTFGVDDFSSPVKNG
jgi:hypothetical protein